MLRYTYNCPSCEKSVKVKENYQNLDHVSSVFQFSERNSAVKTAVIVLLTHYEIEDCL
jgi:hypothetical protein